MAKVKFWPSRQSRSDTVFREIVDLCPRELTAEFCCCRALGDSWEALLVSANLGGPSGPAR